ncbi:MAG: hypothetical protein K1X55_17650 [Chitinophagales bacterium]|nr:hypothetical protein [Chitinophagales bacterium]
MKLERRSEKIASLPKFIVRVGRYAMYAFVLILISLAIGMVGYHWIADLNWIDSLYMSSMILTGMGPVSPITCNTGKLFSSFYALYSGVAFLSCTAVFFAPIFHRIMHILHLDEED